MINSVLRDKIKQMLVEAMKSKDQATTSTLRVVSAAIKDKDIDARPKGNMDGISDAEILSLFQTLIKQRKESITLYQQGGRQDLVDKEEAEITLIKKFLPEELPEEKMIEAIKSIISETGAQSIKDMGKVVSQMREKYAGQIDMAKASEHVKKLLG